MAALDQLVGQVFDRAATASSSRDRSWYVAQARRHYKHARVGLRHAVRVRSETMLCVEQAQESLTQVGRKLDQLDD